MSLITINFHNNESKYNQLYLKIKNDIINNVLKKNEKLPSKRTLAKHLNVSINTIYNAYAMLLSEGYIRSIEKKGYFVSDLTFQNNYSFEKNLISSENKILYDFTTKDIDNFIFPINSYSKIIKELLQTKKTLIKTPNKGSISLRETLKNYLYEQKGITVNINNIIIGCGIEYLLSTICSIIPSKLVTLENPCYNKLKDIFLNNNKIISYVNVTSNGLNIDELNKLSSDIIYVTPASQFPTGKTMGIDNKLEIINYSKNNNTHIIEDDFDSEFRIIGNPPITIYSLYPNKTIYLFSFSRSIAPSLRLSFMILPDSLLDSYEKLYQNYSTTVSTLEQLSLNEFIKSGLYTRHINRLKNSYHQKRDMILKNLSNYSDLLEIIHSNSYLSILVKIKKKVDITFLKKTLTKNQIDIRFLSDYDNSNNLDNVLIIGYSNINIINIEKALNLLFNIIRFTN